MPNSAIVTAAASGIGLEAARDLLVKGWTVYGINISDAALAPAARKLSSQRFRPRPCDLLEATSVAEVMRGIRKDAPQVNALIASAGVIRTGPLAQMSVEDFDTVFGVNVRGLWLTCRETQPMLQKAAADGELARVIILSSISAIRPKIDSGAYSASKAAVSQLTQVLAVEWAADGILVNALAPGTVDTQMIRAAADQSNRGN